MVVDKARYQYLLASVKLVGKMDKRRQAQSDSV